MTGPRGIVVTLLALAFSMSAAPATAETTVSLSFDDGWADQMAAKQILADHGLHGTFFVITGRVGTPGHMGWDQVGAVYASGNEIGGHTVTHPDLTTLSPAQQQAEICGGRQGLLARGYPQLSFAYPQGRPNSTSEDLVEQCGYASARGVGGLTESWAESIPPLNRWVIRTRDSVDDADTAITLEEWVLDAEAVSGGWLNLVFHHICDPISDPACPDAHMTPSDLNAFLDWLAPREAIGTEVRTIGEVILANPQPLFSFRALRSRRNGTAKLTVYVGRSGVLQVVDARCAGAATIAAKRRPRIRPVSIQATHAGTVTLTLRPSSAGRRALTNKDRLIVPARATFTPLRGTSPFLAIKVKLKRELGT
jgi:peptidoglycan/xylan/chitin deacetylase (PgdA/CDA1 family)